ncbi:hypothetical protein [Paraburkholderia youngii]|uniref:hypothetical protein n=1 Tax=Paraburkholderia youngii TaxID=2782701 RepID=UPI0015914682|nr:hypothetical protein [Paraburkholderia youngii]NUX58677.1 hypothetical protein [Paraburkholderia youngii]
MHEYKTFIAALLAVIEGSEERTRAIKAHDKEPHFTRYQDGTEVVTFSSQVFTLILHRSPRARTWAHQWTWTDTANTAPAVNREFRFNGILYRATPHGTIERYDGGSLGYTPTASLAVYNEARRLGLIADTPAR